MLKPFIRALSHATHSALVAYGRTSYHVLTWCLGYQSPHQRENGIYLFYCVNILFPQIARHKQRNELRKCVSRFNVQNPF